MTQFYSVLFTSCIYIYIYIYICTYIQDMYKIIYTALSYIPKIDLNIFCLNTISNKTSNKV